MKKSKLPQLGALMLLAATGASWAQMRTATDPAIAVTNVTGGPPEATTAQVEPSGARKDPKVTAAAYAPSADVDLPVEDFVSARSPREGVEHVVWDRTPIAVELRVGQERMIVLPKVMRIGKPPAISTSLRVQIVGRAAYLTALRPFSKTRVVAEEESTGQAILLDVRGSPKSTSGAEVADAAQPIDITLSQPASIGSSGTSLPVEHEESRSLNPFELTSFAAIQTYGPRRLSGGNPGVRPLSIEPRELARFYRGFRLQAKPIGSWRSGEFYVTAVQLTNLEARAIDLDPRALDGRWVSASFQHGRLLPKGDLRDTTAVYVVSDRPFFDSL